MFFRLSLYLQSSELILNFEVSLFILALFWLSILWTRVWVSRPIPRSWGHYEGYLGTAVTLGASSAAAALDIDRWTTLDQGLLIVPRAWPAPEVHFCCLSAGADSGEQCCLHHALVHFMSGSDPWQLKEDGDLGGIFPVCHLLVTLPFGFLHASKAENGVFIVVPPGQRSSLGVALTAAIARSCSF